MSAPATPSDEPIVSKDQLVEHLCLGCKPKRAWRIGTEHEKFAFTAADCRPLPYEGPRGVRALLEGLTAYGWEPVLEGDKPIALRHADASSISLEPGGQIELSGAPLETLHQTCAEVWEHARQVKAVGDRLGIAMLGLGFTPTWRREQVPWMPKARYDIMRRYMPKVGTLGLDMMLRTCTVQVNLDFEDEADMARKFRVGMALQSVATALFANSPFSDGAPNGFLSYRSQVWTDTDNDRCGILPFVFEDGFGFERYVDWALDVPMYFVYRDGRYIDAAGQSFRDFMDGRLPALPGERATMGDWGDHLTTLFPEVRLKRFLEMRGADGGPWARICALPALWVGLLYDRRSLDAAHEMIADWTAEEVLALRTGVPRHALATPFRNGTTRDLALKVLSIAREGLARRAVLDAQGRDESHFLDPLFAIVEAGRTQAEDLLALYEEAWDHDLMPLFKEFAY